MPDTCILHVGCQLPFAAVCRCITVCRAVCATCVVCALCAVCATCVVCALCAVAVVVVWPRRGRSRCC